MMLRDKNFITVTLKAVIWNLLRQFLYFNST